VCTPEGESDNMGIDHDTAGSGSGGSPSERPDALDPDKNPDNSSGDGNDDNNSDNGNNSGDDTSVKSGPCSDEGLWSCSGDQFQRCASGYWSAMMDVAPGTVCTPEGESDNMGIDHDTAGSGSGGSPSAGVTGTAAAAAAAETMGFDDSGVGAVRAGAGTAVGVFGLLAAVLLA
jgi:hypothetical protein